MSLNVNGQIMADDIFAVKKLDTHRPVYLLVGAIEKIVVNMGVGEAVADSKKIQLAVAEMAAITGQKPAETRSKKAISNFKLRKDQAIGAKVTGSVKSMR